jgi:pimeloyl-ACP methyl ester carboxylesterase
VLIPGRRGFVSVEPLLRATSQNLADDASAAVAYLRGRADVDGGALALLGQADDAPAAILAAAGPAQGIPLVLLAPPGFPGQEVFRLEQLALAERERFRPEEVEMLEAHVAEIARIVLGEGSQEVRASQLQVQMLRARVRLPYSASFPSDEGQVHFLSSPIWRDRMAFDPVAALGTLRSPVLLVIGAEDADTPMNPYLANMRRGLGATGTNDWVVCRIEGRTRHTFSEVGVETITGWLAERVGRTPETPPPPPRSCLADP